MRILIPAAASTPKTSAAMPMRPLDILAHQANNRHLGLEIDFAQRLQLRDQLPQLLASFHGHRRGGSGDGDNLALQMMPAQQAEQIIQKAQRANMARRANIENRDVPLDRDGAEGRRRLARPRRG